MMARRLSSILLILISLFASVGLIVHKHYCEAQLVATSILPHVGDACDTEMPMGDDSCTDHHDSYKVDNPFQSISFGVDITPSFEWVVVSYVDIVKPILNPALTTKLFADINPPPSEPGIYTKVQSFLL